MQVIDNYIGGAWVPGQSYLPGIEPATGKQLYQVVDSDQLALDHALQSAQEAFPAWAATSVQDRAACLKRLSVLIKEHQQELAYKESLDTGKPLSLASSLDIPRSASNLEFFASAIEQYATAAHAMGNAAINYTLQQPIGVVACISPWNLPLYLLTWKIAPALAAGNCVLAKPSELTPLTAAYLAGLVSQAGFPPGVINILHGRGQAIGQALCEAKQVGAVSFTGGTHTGATIASLLAPQFKKYSLELGGKNPAIVLADCDLDKVVPQLVRASFTNQGEICLAASRILVQRQIYPAFRAAFVAATQALCVGDPLLAETEVGALISATHQQKVLDYIALAQREGGRVLTGGDAVRVAGRCHDGFFVAPTVIEGLAAECRTNQEEIFGPVITLTPFEQPMEALAIANNSRYGLAASVWTDNLSVAHSLAAKLQHGIVWVNCWLLRDLRTPFGGMKDSGVGREGGIDALRFFTETKNVCIHYG